MWEDNKKAWDRWNPQTPEEALSRHAPVEPSMFPKPHCPVCRRTVDTKTGILKHWLDYENKFRKLAVPPGATKEQRDKLMHKRLRNFKTRARKAKRNGEPKHAMPSDLQAWFNEREEARKRSR